MAPGPNRIAKLHRKCKLNTSINSSSLWFCLIWRLQLHQVQHLFLRLYVYWTMTWHLDKRNALETFILNISWQWTSYSARISYEYDTLFATTHTCLIHTHVKDYPQSAQAISRSMATLSGKLYFSYRLGMTLVTSSSNHNCSFGLYTVILMTFGCPLAILCSRQSFGSLIISWLISYLAKLMPLRLFSMNHVGKRTTGSHKVLASWSLWHAKRVVQVESLGWATMQSQLISLERQCQRPLLDQEITSNAIVANVLFKTSWLILVQGLCQLSSWNLVAM